ncbi:MAG: hypothetical protein ND895_00780 [Pyrinomonadaceae bacterium]|nr:hypothetical protein [Pyrinomonadaceae bacterium]
MRDTNLSTTSSGFLIPAKIFVALMITAMLVGIMLIPTTEVRAQRVNRETLTRPSKGSVGDPVPLAPTRPNERTEARTQAPASAIQEADPNGPPKKKAIVGSWIETVTFTGAGAPPPFKSLGTYAEDGNLVVADQGNDTSVLPFVFSPGHGAWVHLHGRKFAWTVIELVTDLSGNLVATLKVRGEHTVNHAGDAYTGHFRAELFDPLGNLFDSSEGTNQGRRIQVEPLP